MTTPTTDHHAAIELTGHDSQDTAHLVKDYPYGFRLRTEIRYWIETKQGQGQRLVSQTRDPKKAGQPWNKPKPGIYHPIVALLENPENGHIENDALSPYATEEQIRAFVAKYPETCAEARNRRVWELLIARQRAYQGVTWTTRTLQPGEEGTRQTPAEQAEILSKRTAIELAKLRAEGAK